METSHNYLPTYENFIAWCPYCDNRNVYNRISDLKTTELIDSKIVSCYECKKDFNINGDLVADDYVYLFYDIEALMKEKQYMACVINLCQVCEVFFNQAIAIKLIWKPFQDNTFLELDDANKLSTLLFKTIYEYTYLNMLSVFIDLYYYEKTFTSFSGIENYILGLQGKKFNKILKKRTLKNCTDEKKKKLFMMLQNLKINDLRNIVIHKLGKRPTFDEVNSAKDQVSKIILPLADMYNIEPYEWYGNNRIQNDNIII